MDRFFFLSKAGEELPCIYILSILSGWKCNVITTTQVIILEVFVRHYIGLPRLKTNISLSMPCISLMF